MNRLMQYAVNHEYAKCLFEKYYFKELLECFSFVNDLLGYTLNN